MPITLAGVLADANNLWNGFLEYLKAQNKQRSHKMMFSITAPSIASNMALDLFWVVRGLLHYYENHNKADITKIIFHGGEDLSGNSLKTPPAEHELTDRATSWLSREGNNPVILIDNKAIETLAYHPPDPNRTIHIVNRLMLHELGHIVLHWEVVKNDTERGCLPEHDEQAWWFCEAIIARAVGAYARAYRDRHEHDAGWQHG